MKTLKLIVVGIILFVSSSMQSQVSVNVNLGRPPAWGPAVNANVGYYYLPDIESYYDIRNSQFIYYGGGNWVRSRNLPSQYRNYNLYNGYKVVLSDYRGTRPYTYFKNHKVKYYKGYKGNSPKAIGKHDNRGDNQGRGNDQGHGNNGYKGGKENKGHGKNK